MEGCRPMQRPRPMKTSRPPSPTTCQALRNLCAQHTSTLHTPDEHPIQRKQHRRSPNTLTTAKSETSWISRWRTSKNAPFSCVRQCSRTGTTTPPAPISAIQMTCRKRIRWARRYGSSTARPKLNYPIKSGWKT